MFEYSTLSGSTYGGGGRVKRTKTFKKTLPKVRKQYKEPYVSPFVPAPEAAMIDLQSLINVAQADISSALQGTLPKTMEEVRQEAKHLAERTKATRTIERAIIEPLLQKRKRPEEVTQEMRATVRGAFRALEQIPITEYERKGQEQIKETMKLLDRIAIESMTPRETEKVTEKTIEQITTPTIPGGPRPQPIIRYQPVPYFIGGGYYPGDLTTGGEPEGEWWENIDWWKVAIFGGLALIVVLALVKGGKRK